MKKLSIIFILGFSVGGFLGGGKKNRLYAMKLIYKLLVVLVIPVSMFSCVATNNLYVNSSPIGEGNGELYVGVGTGVAAKIDYVSPEDNAVHFSDKISTVPVLSIGCQAGMTNHTDLRLAVHFPWGVGGYGLRAGAQYSVFDSGSRMNIAIGTDLGFALTMDTLKILGIHTKVEKQTNSAVNADFFLPVSFKNKHGFSIVLTPRYSFSTIYVRNYVDDWDAKPFHVAYPALSLGIRIKKIYLEVTTLYFDSSVYPQFGMAWMMSNEGA